MGVVLLVLLDFGLVHVPQSGIPVKWLLRHKGEFIVAPAGAFFVLFHIPLDRDAVFQLQRLAGANIAPD